MMGSVPLPAVSPPAGVLAAKMRSKRLLRMIVTIRRSHCFTNAPQLPGEHLLNGAVAKLLEQGARHEDGGHQGSHKGHHGDLGVDGRAGGILEWVSDGIANHGCLVLF